jgi:hypothetical protein
LRVAASVVHLLPAAEATETEYYELVIAQVAEEDFAEDWEELQPVIQEHLSDLVEVLRAKFKNSAGQRSTTAVSCTRAVSLQAKPRQLTCCCVSRCSLLLILYLQQGEHSRRECVVDMTCCSDASLIALMASLGINMTTALAPATEISSMLKLSFASMLPCRSRRSAA